jgi:hypothetical protein
MERFLLIAAVQKPSVERKVKLERMAEISAAVGATVQELTNEN